MTSTSVILGIALAVCFAFNAAGADMPALPSKPVVRMVSPGMYEVGKVRLDGIAAFNLSMSSVYRIGAFTDENGNGACDAG